MDSMDLFAEALWQLYRTGRATMRIEREDGYVSAEDLTWYLTGYRDFLPIEKQVLEFARGRVLDIGCGAGRHALYLQRRGLEVVGIDSSPRMVELARARGVKDARVTNACGRLPFDDGEFDTVILLGNNLGICGTPQRFRRMLRELHRVTLPRGCILGTTRQPSTTNPLHRRYISQLIRGKRAIGQMRFRLVFKGTRGAWFDFLLLAPTDLMQLAMKEGWELAHVFPLENFESGYAAVLEKG